MDYLTKQTSVASKLRTLGQPITLIRTQIRGFNPVTGAGTEAKRREDFMGVVTNYRLSDLARSYIPSSTGQGGNSLIARGDLLVLLPANGTIAPEVGDQLIIQKESWKVLWVDSINPAGTPVLYKVQVRK